ncbi:MULTISPECIES: hypothetical protein [unclassified Nocardioides]|uniref:hypothetical protein n=1 Tax=unclassified Nocardioides TaxID=2615069 RepID=UPI0006FCB689|nr:MULTISPECIES: hypothetical protein [unclassified Nocardioides]KQY57506.1 hypothetical protein ASD30_15075 [Nocardioides sp. Root140]KRF20296.1 hypothetical protein ASH02_21470 [Nocardioides sp. Soil796]
MSKRKVYLHIGAPKTGTTYVQDRLALNARGLTGHGVHFPNKRLFADPTLFHFRAALDLLGQDWGGPSGHADGSWATMLKQVRRRSGTVIISHEILAPAPADKIARVMNDLSDSEIHVVYSARDMVRQLPAAWQESVKQGRRWTFERFLAKAEHGSPWFMKAFDLPAVLEAWGRSLPPERLHVVTVPQGRTDSNLLWKRFCTAFGVDPTWAPLDSERSNAGLGVAETELLRRLNRQLDRTTRSTASHDELIQTMLDRSELGRRRSRKVQLPPAHYAWAQGEAERWIAWAERVGVDVVGDLADLRSGEPPADLPEDPNEVRAKAITKAAVSALTVMTREAASRPDPSREIGARLKARAEQMRQR